MAKPKDPMDDVIGLADRQLAMALVRVGNKASESDAPKTETLTVDGFAVLVAVKRIPDDERAEKWNGLALYHVMMRVDVAASGKSVDEVDRWLMAQEAALNALVKAWRNKMGPFVGYSLRHNVTAPDDPWVGHITTTGNHRTDLWIIGEPWQKIEAARGGG